MLTDKKLVEYMNENVVCVLAHGTQDFCEGHPPLPNGDCWVYTGLKCADHHEIFNRGPGTLMDFGGSPGHYLWKYPTVPVPGKQDFIYVDDRKLARQDSAETWLKTYKEAQEKLGPGLSRTEYLAQQKEFEALAQSMDKTRLTGIAENPRAAFRVEAAILVAELNKPGDWVERDAVAKVERLVHQGQFGQAMSAIRQLSSRKIRDVLRLRDLEKTIERIAWQRLIDARMLAGAHKDAAGAKAAYQELVDRFAGTEVHKVAKKELEALP